MMFSGTADHPQLAALAQQTFSPRWAAFSNLEAGNGAIMANMIVRANRWGLFLVTTPPLDTLWRCVDVCFWCMASSALR